MNLKTHNILFFSVVCISAFALFHIFELDRLSSTIRGFGRVVDHTVVNLTLIAYFMILNLVLHRKQLLKTLIYSSIAAIISYFLTYETFVPFIHFLQDIDQSSTSLGFYLGHLWFSMIFLSVYLIIFTSLIYKILHQE